MRVRQTEETLAGEPRYNAATLRKAASLAARLQSRQQETLSAHEIEAIGAEAGLEPAFMREALARFTQKKQPARSRPYRAYAIAWWSAAWTLPIFSTAFGRGNLFVILFYFLIGVYIAVGVLLSQAAKSARSSSAVLEDGASRETILEMLHSLHQELKDEDEHRAFLCVAVAGGDGLKHQAGEAEEARSIEPLRDWIGRVTTECGAEMRGAAAEGDTFLFATDAAAVRAALRLQEELPQFRREHPQSSGELQLRCGVAAGEIVIHEDTPLDQWRSTVIDHAAALAKQAVPGEILLGGEVSAGALLQLKGATPTPEPVLGEVAFSWRAPA
jgi:class 3 adenylate cyclase